MLVASQIGISLLLLVAAGLFVCTLSNLQSIELGFNREDVLLFQLNARQAGHKDPEIFTFYGGLQRRFAELPGVRGASASHSPLLGSGTSSGQVVPVGQEPKRGEGTHVLTAAPDFFATMRIPILLGRALDARDQPGSTPVVVVSEAYAKKYFGDRNPIGEHIYGPRWALKNVDKEIVGVAKNVRYGELKGEFPTIAYFPFGQGPSQIDGMTFALRTSGNPLRYVNSVREIVRQADRSLPVTDIKTQAAQIDQTMNQEIIFARFCTVFAIVALLIACVGLYGTMSYTAARRTGEIGIRMSLGRGECDVIRMVLRWAFALSAIGLATGVPGPGCLEFVESFLFGVKANDTAALFLAVAILLSAVLVANYVPARKASRIDPLPPCGTVACQGGDYPEGMTTSRSRRPRGWRLGWLASTRPQRRAMDRSPGGVGWLALRSNWQAIAARLRAGAVRGGRYTLVTRASLGPYQQAQRRSHRLAPEAFE